MIRTYGRHKRTSRWDLLLTDNVLPLLLGVAWVASAFAYLSLRMGVS
jgi:hypothetical protein